MATSRMRHESERVLEEHGTTREWEQMGALTRRDESVDRASVYSFSDSSSSSVSDLVTDPVTVAYPHPGGKLHTLTGSAPVNFASVVSQKIYRCGYPAVEHYDFLRTLDLKTIVTLVDKDVPAPYVQFMKDAGIRHIICPVTPNKGEHKRTTIKQIAAALTVMIDPKHHPVLIHCNKGKHRSGCVTASFRKCLGMGMDIILDEYALHAGEKARELDVAFIRAFDEKYFLGSIRSNTLMNTAPLEDLEHIIDPLLPLGRVPRPRV